MISSLRIWLIGACKTIQVVYIVGSNLIDHFNILHLAFLTEFYFLKILHRFVFY